MNRIEAAVVKDLPDFVLKAMRIPVENRKFIEHFAKGGEIVLEGHVHNSSDISFTSRYNNYSIVEPRMKINVTINSGLTTIPNKGQKCFVPCLWVDGMRSMVFNPNYEHHIELFKRGMLYNTRAEAFSVLNAVFPIRHSL